MVIKFRVWLITFEDVDHAPRNTVLHAGRLIFAYGVQRADKEVDAYVVLQELQDIGLPDDDDDDDETFAFLDPMHR